VNALIVVDVQNDFMPYGALPVADGDAVVAIANELMPLFEFVVATQDWHPADHGSFASSHPGRVPGDVVMLSEVEQVLWPDHCVQNTPGASFHSALDVASIRAVVHKGIDPGIDSYSTFYDNGHRRNTGLATILREIGVTEVTLLGLATDYCVLYSALDALDEGFAVTVVRDGVRAVDLAPGDGERALKTMSEAGVRIVESCEILAESVPTF
jgi:nicotinamidase/pyrazinamidase